MSKKKTPKNSAQTAKDLDLQKDIVPVEDVLTTNQGLAISDDQNSLKAGVRGPTLLEDFHFREKIQHFDHERIPERVVHARGSAAHGFFQPYESLADLTMASLFQDPKKQTPVFLRFSTVAGFRGSADTPRDVRGFALKFYTETGIWDLVGNNIPVFFIQDAIKFPDLIHAVKPEPHNEIPQAASAHDTFWDFASLTPESTHMLMWAMSDRTLPRSFSNMQGFGIHTFRLINAKGKSRFVKFHFKPIKGIHSLVWDESQKIMGKDADFQRRDLYESIERGDFPEWEMGLQIVEEKDEMKFDFDLLDPTKIIPEEQVPVRPIGKLVLNRNPDNFFAETEQAAFHPGHVVQGIDFSNDPLLQGRLFSYLDTQITRVGQNFAELPINRPINPVSNNQRDGKMRIGINPGRVAYSPNTLGNGFPSQTGKRTDGPNVANLPDTGFHSYAEKIDATKIRQRSPSFLDHFSQATLFWNSMSDWEKAHIVAAFSFELNNCMSMDIKDRVVNGLLVNVADELAQKVANNIGIKISAKPKTKPHNKKSPALSMDNPLENIVGRKVAILAGPGVDAKVVNALKKRLTAEQALSEVIAQTKEPIKAADGSSLPVDRPAPNAASVIYDAVFVPGGESAVALAKKGSALEFVSEAYSHGKPIGATGEGADVLQAARVETDADGVVVADSTGQAIDEFIAAMHQHRFPYREKETDPTK